MGRGRWLAAAGAADAPRRFWFQCPPTVRIQPGPSDQFVNPHSDAKYGHQAGELNFWMPLSPYRPTSGAGARKRKPGKSKAKKGR